MALKANEDILKRRLKFYLPALFVLAGIISVATFSILLKTVYELSSTIISYLYVFIFVLIAVFCISIYFDCLKLERGKSIAIGRLYVLKAGLAVVLVAVFSYSIHIYAGKISIFEMLNIRLVMVIFLISIAMSISSVSFNMLVKPLYKKTGKREYHLPIAYSFIPISMATVIFIVTLVNGMHYRSEVIYDREYDIIQKKGYANDFFNNVSTSVQNYVNISESLLTYMRVLSRTRYGLDNYVNVLSTFLSTRYANDYNISSFSIFFADTEDINIAINDPEVNNLFINWRYDVNNLSVVSTNYRPNVAENILSKLYNGTNFLIDMESDSDVFYIYTPIVLNNNANVGFITLEVKSTVYRDLLLDSELKNNLDVYITDDLYIIKDSNNPASISTMQNDLDNPVIGGEIKDTINNNTNNNFTKARVLNIKDSNIYSIKYSLFNNLHVINIWRHKNAYQNQLFRNTILKSSITIYFGLFAFLMVILILILSLRKTLVFAKNVSESLSEGEGDLTIRLPVISNNESGELVHSFNKFLEKVRNIIVSILL